MNNKVSVIIPVFNMQSYIKETIISVQKQTYENYEIIIINDASYDNTMKIVSEMAAEDSRIHIYNLNRNFGAAYARNFGIQKAKGDWIAFLDGDDLWVPTKLEKQLNLSEITQGEFIFTGSKFIDEKGKTLKGILKVPFEVKYKALLKQNIISCSSVLIKRKILNSFQMEEGKFHEDFLLWLKILKQGYTAYGVDQPLLIYRISKKSKSGNKMKAAYMTFNVYKKMGLNFAEILYYWLNYALRSLCKYRMLKK